jgi:adenylate kinase
MINIVLFGAPGCGKGTQAALLKEQLGFEHLSTGELIRDHIRRETSFGLEVKACIERGQLAPDEVVISMIEDYVKTHKDCKGCIFDGFPRTTPQAEAFDQILKQYGLRVELMIDIDVDEEELVQRILLRGKDSGRADDASEEVIRQRLEVYHRQTAVVADYYCHRGKYRAVDGHGTVEEVFQRISALLRPLL